MKNIFTFLIAVFCFCNFANADLTIVLNGDDSGRPGDLRGTGNLPDIVRAAADAWEAVYAPDTSIDGFTLEIDFGWGDLPGVAGSFLAEHTLTGQETINGIHRQTSGQLTFDNSLIGRTFADPTPFDHSEYARFTERTRDLGGGRPNTERFFSDGTGAASGAFDLYSIALHEIGHALGLSSDNSEFIREARTEGDDTVEITSPLPFAGSVFVLEDDNAHFLNSRFPNAVLSPVVDLGERRLLTDVDILINAQISQFNAAVFTEVPVTVVPEPSSLVFSVLLLPLVFRRRK